jgi:hypothetical protein
MYDGIPVLVDDFVSDTQTQGTATNQCSSVYAVKFGQGTGIMGLEHGGIAVDPLGELETKDASRWRIKWYATQVRTKNRSTALDRPRLFTDIKQRTPTAFQRC